VPSNPYLANPRWTLAEDVAAAVCRRYPEDTYAVGVHGALAHGDDTDGSDIDLRVVTVRAHAGPRPARRRIGGIIVDLDVVARDEYLRHARTLDTSWPLSADGYLTTKAIYDPDGWHDRLRDTHLGRLADARGLEFAALAREAWCHAQSMYSDAIRLAQWHDTAGALLALGEARLSAALVEGLLSRTYFRGGADAVSRTGLGEADLPEVGRRLSGQADELTRRGHPVDGTIADLLA
jgi:predicted nucleotidyltransferase